MMLLPPTLMPRSSARYCFSFMGAPHHEFSIPSGMTARSLPLTRLMGAERKLDKVWYLTRINLFAGIGESEMQRVAERATMQTFGRGRVILHPGERQELVYLIKEGRVKLSRYSSDGREQILTLLEPGDVFGEFALVEKAEPVHVEAIEDTLICALNRGDRKRTRLNSSHSQISHAAFC